MPHSAIPSFHNVIILDFYNQNYIALNTTDNVKLTCYLKKNDMNGTCNRL